MASGIHGDDLHPLTAVSHEDRLVLLSEGSFRCRPCASCGNSDPRLIELEGKSGEAVQKEAGNGEDAGGREAAQRLKCKGCDRPYTLMTSSDEEEFSSSALGDDYGLDFAGIECCKDDCCNREPDLFSVSRHDNGHLRSITCLVCHHGNTFHQSDARAWPVSSHAADVGESTDVGMIECFKCLNANVNLFDFTYHPDGRIHKITCLVCDHGNTFPAQPQPAPATSTDERRWFSWKAVSSAAQGLASPVWSTAQSVVQKSAQSAFNLVSKQVSDNVQNKRPVAEGLREMGAGQVAAIGKNLVLELGDKYLRKLLPMIPEPAAKVLTRNISEIVSQLALKLLAAEQAKKKTQKNAANPANSAAKGTPPADA